MLVEVCERKQTALWLVHASNTTVGGKLNINQPTTLQVLVLINVSPPGDKSNSRNLVMLFLCSHSVKHWLCEHAELDWIKLLSLFLCNKLLMGETVINYGGTGSGLAYFLSISEKKLEQQIFKLNHRVNIKMNKHVHCLLLSRAEANL